MAGYHGLYSLPSPVKLYGVCESRMKFHSLELWRRQRLLREHRLTEFEWRYRKGEKTSWLLCERLFRQGESGIPCHQLAKPKEMKRHAGACLAKPASIKLVL